MTIKSYVQTPLVKTTFPKLMRSISEPRRVVLFTNETCGTVLVSNVSEDEVGQHSECWDIDQHVEFFDEVVLVNSRGA